MFKKAAFKTTTRKTRFIQSQKQTTENMYQQPNNHEPGWKNKLHAPYLHETSSSTRNMKKYDTTVK